MKKSLFKCKNTFLSYDKIMVIAEIGSNHNKSFKNIKKLIKLAKQSGCDAVKFQLFKSEQLVPIKSKGYKILKEIELDHNWIKKIYKECKKNNILFGCSPFYLEAVDLLKKYCDFIKIASPEIRNIKLIQKSIKTQLPIIISTGYSNYKEVNKVFRLINKKKLNKYAFLHCISQYPTPNDKLNLFSIPFLKSKYPNISIGFSDHSEGELGAIIACSLGANIIEKHITLSKKMKGPDHFFAADRKDIKKYVKAIRDTELSFGKFQKIKNKNENHISIAPYSKNKILKNTEIFEKDVIYKRCFGNGLSYEKSLKIYGKKAKKTIPKDTEINFNLVNW